MIKLSSIIKNLIPGLTEKGKIKIGRKGATREKQGGGTYQLPQKLDHFLVTTLERGKDNNFVIDEQIHSIIGKEPKSIPVKLLFDDIALNFQCRYACYNGKTLFCSGDGEVALRMNPGSAERIEVQCPCNRQDPTYTGTDKCKINGTLSVMIDGVNSVGGIHKFRTTGYNSTVGILSSLTLIRSLTGGFLAGLPLRMSIQPKVCTNPVDGSSQTVYVVGIEFAGTMDDLYGKTLAIAQKNADFRARMIHVEDEVKKLISVDSSLIDEAGDIQEEFYPEEDERPVLTLETDTAKATSEPVDAGTGFVEVKNSEVKTENKAPITRLSGKKSAAKVETVKDPEPEQTTSAKEPEQPAPTLELDPAIDEADFFGGAE
jgi:hypothetical protein